MTSVIKLRFIRHGEPLGREYSYYTNTEVVVGDIVEFESRGSIVQGVVTQTDVPEAEIAAFGYRAKTIIGRAELAGGRVNDAVTDA